MNEIMNYTPFPQRNMSATSSHFLFFNAPSPSSSSPTSLKKNTDATTSARVIEDLLVSKLNDMSLQQRSQGLEDIHGVLDVNEETPAMIQGKVKEMNRFLDLACAASSLMSPSPSSSTSSSSDASSITMDTSAYEKAVSMSADYVNSLKIQFLRADSYDPRAAAERMIRFFIRKKELFGEDKLARAITLSDLGEEGNIALYRGLIQLLPYQDQAGRAILFISGFELMFYSNKSVARILFYRVMKALQDDEEIQRKGFVMISYARHQSSFVPGRAAEHLKNWTSVPWRVAAFHECVDTNQDSIFFPLYEICCSLDDENICRFRMHTGSDMECISKLITFGIPREAIPIGPDGKINLTSHHRRLEAIALKEKLEEEKQHQQQSVVEFLPSPAPGEVTTAAATTASNTGDDHSLILSPSPMDIQMGRGKRQKSRPGGNRFHQLLMEHKDAHDVMSRLEKTRLSDSILQTLKQGGCRFIVATAGGFVECDDIVAREKIAHGFRNLRLKKNKNKKMTN